MQQDLTSPVQLHQVAKEKAELLFSFSDTGIRILEYDQVSIIDRLSML